MFSLLPFLTDSDDLLDQWTIGLLAIIVIYLGWRSTYVREDRPQSQAAVLVIENNLHQLNRIAQQPVTINILRSSSQQSNISNVTETEELDLENDSIASSIDNITQSILTEASESATGLDLSDSEAYPSTSGVSSVSGGPSGGSIGGGRSSLNEEVDPGPEEIIRQMDQDLDETDRARSVISSSSSEEAPISDGVRQRKTALNGPVEADAVNGQSAGASDKSKEQLESKQIRIKLKYLNDDSKLVEGNLNEGVGDFKKRNFTIELAAKKLVRLVFNGHVLQPDTKTLAACGLFDNCVVHCLIHNPKPQAGDNITGIGGSPVGNGSPNGMGGLSNGGGFTNGAEQQNGENTWRNRLGSYFIYIGTFILSATIAYCWYCRFQYGHLFNLNSTIGLIVTTTIFLIMMPTIILTDSNSAN